ncbi:MULTISPECIES: hypothetical protein [Flavobacterium]|uniref:hypothetical protein n=1 Tax=Flavobacterium TaxID=237 RepID=UPI00118297A1|nr:MULTISPECIES: hypothetical protein [Flavobacterium]MCR4032148.1 hypothetical protein [Flavobacterium panacis]
MKKQTASAYILAMILIPCILLGQRQEVIKLADLYKKAKLIPINRQIKIVSGHRGAYLKISENKKEGIVWLPVKDFSNGTIEIEMRGKDVFQRSFIGVAFHGTDDSKYDAVYCRPFNFFAKDSVRRIHALQYISQPDFTWEKLRNEYNALYEKEIPNPPNPDGWFIMRLEIEAATVRAYINNAEYPSLTVEKLGNQTKGKIGLFTADSSGGDFKVIKILYKK